MVGTCLDIEASYFEIDKLRFICLVLRLEHKLLKFESTFYDSTTTQLRCQSFDNRLEDEPRVRTLIRQSLVNNNTERWGSKVEKMK